MSSVIKKIMPDTSTSSPLALGIDFGGTSVKLGLVRDGQLVTRGTPIPTSGHTQADDLFADILHGIATLRANAAPVAIGVGLPGPVDHEAGIVHELSNVPGWANVPLRDQLRRETGLPTCIDNDAKAMTYAEWKFGAGRGGRNVICVTLGTGVGGGLILEGKLFRGSRNGAGEIGNVSIDYRGVPGNYGNFGAVEKYVGNREIAARAVELYARAGGRARSLDECTPLALEDAARAGDAIAQGLWRETGEMLGACLADVVWLLNPDSIVLGGGVAKAGDLIFTPLRETIAARTSRVFSERLQIVPAQLGSDAGLIGAAALGVDQAAAAA